MKKSILAFLFLLFLAFGCKSDCEKQNTATMTVINNSTEKVLGFINDTNDFSLEVGSEKTFMFSPGTFEVTVFTDNKIDIVTIELQQCEEKTINVNF